MFLTRSKYILTPDVLYLYFCYLSIARVTSLYASLRLEVQDVRNNGIIFHVCVIILSKIIPTGYKRPKYP